MVELVEQCGQDLSCGVSEVQIYIGEASQETCRLATPTTRRTSTHSSLPSVRCRLDPPMLGPVDPPALASTQTPFIHLVYSTNGTLLLLAHRTTIECSMEDYRATRILAYNKWLVSLRSEHEPTKMVVLESSPIAAARCCCHRRYGSPRPNGCLAEQRSTTFTASRYQRGVGVWLAGGQRSGRRSSARRRISLRRCGLNPSRSIFHRRCGRHIVLSSCLIAVPRCCTCLVNWLLNGLSSQTPHTHTRVPDYVGIYTGWLSWDMSKSYASEITLT